MSMEDRVAWRELLVALGAALVQIGVPVVTSHGAGSDPVPLTGVALLAAGVAAIPLRLAQPIAALVIAFSATLAFASLGFDGRGPIYVGLIITFGYVVIRGHRRVALVTLVAGYVGFLWLGPALGRGDAPGPVGALALAAWLSFLYTVAELLRSRRERAQEAATARESSLQRQIANERLAIARELHDVVAHNMSLVNVQAGVALHVTDELPASTREALETIKAASKEALVELRSILGVLRHAEEGDAAPRAPAPTLDALDDLAARARASGVDVTIRGEVDAASLPRPVQMAAYRIIQESLTNVAKHADPPIAVVTLRCSDRTLIVSVADPGTGHRHGRVLPGGGNGIPGMRERAASVGGSLAAGPRLGGGFLVEARLPLGEG